MYNYQISLVFMVAVFLISNSVIGAPKNFKDMTTASSRWSDAGHTIGIRAYTIASSLTNGKVLVTGGLGYDYCTTTEWYDPLTGKWTNASNMSDCRFFHTASTLKNGQVLVAGGYIDDPEYSKNVKFTLNGAELYDSRTETWTRTGSLNHERHSHTASVLSNGKVLVVGGLDDDFLNSAELYDPSTGNWSTTDSMYCKRVWHAAIVLVNGKVLITGGISNENGTSKTVKLYDPSTEKWENVSSMNYARFGHTATLLTNGKVLVVGGLDRTGIVLNSTELFDPSTGTWKVTGSMSNGRSKHTASLLTNGNVLIVGGGNSNTFFPGVNPINTAEIYDLSTGTWTNTSSMHYERAWHTASVLENGNVLVVGGNQIENTSAFIPELYNSSTSTLIPINKSENVQSLHKDFVSTL